MKMTIEELSDIQGEDEDFLSKNKNILEKMAVVTLIEQMRGDIDPESRIKAATTILAALGKDKGQRPPELPQQNNTQINVFMPQMAEALKGLQGVVKALTPAEEPHNDSV
jgi:hypothetical protein